MTSHSQSLKLTCADLNPTPKVSDLSGTPSKACMRRLYFQLKKVLEFGANSVKPAACQMKIKKMMESYFKRMIEYRLNGVMTGASFPMTYSILSFD